MALMTSEETITVQYSKKDCFASMVSAIKSARAFEIDDASDTSWTIKASSTKNMTTWGELILISFADDAGGCAVHISSNAKAPSLLAGKKNVENIHALLAALTEQLKLCDKVATPPPQTDGAVNAKERLATIEALLGSGIITDEEYKTKRAEIIASL